MRTLLFLLGLGTALAVAPFGTIVDGATAFRWALVAAGVALALMHPTSEERPSFAWIGLPLAGVLASLAWTPDVLTGADEALHLAILGAAFALGASVASPAPAWRGIELGVALCLPVVVLQFLGFDLLPQYGVPSGLFGNKNMMAEAALVALVTASAIGAWGFAAAAGLVVALTFSKAVIIGAAVALAVATWRKSPARAAAIVAVVFLGLVAVLLSGSGSLDARLAIWEPAAADLRVFGHGIGAFSATYPQAEYAHNELLHYAYELGVLAVPGLAVFAFALGGSGPERLVLVALGVVGLFSFPLHMPLTGFAAALAAGHLVRGRLLLRPGFERRAAPRGACVHA